MPHISSWLLEEPGPPPADTACRLARSRFWRNGREPFVGSHGDWPDAAYNLGLDPDFAHSLVLALSVLPTDERYDFAEAFFELRKATDRESVPADARTRLAISAAIVLKVVEIIHRPDIRTDRVLDLLRGAAQGDDLTGAPQAAVDEVWKVVARIRLEPEFDDEADPRAAAALALAEVLDPAGDTVAVKEVLARSSWAASHTWERSRVLAFLLEVDRLVGERRPF